MKLDEQKIYVVAELSANHKQQKSIALESIRAAADCGADAIKVQTYTPDTLTIDCDNEYFQIRQGTIWDGRTLYNLYREAYTPWEWHPELKRCAEENGLDFFSSPFDRGAVDLLAGLGVGAYKIASFEINDLELIDYVCAQGKPLILSTGVASLAELSAAVELCRSRGVQPILLHCASAYPAFPSQMNLAMIGGLRSTFGARVGLSDHSEGSTAAIAAVALGATVIEKHFILNKELGGPDSAFSMEPREFKAMVEAIRVAEQCIGRVDYSLSPGKIMSRKFMRSLFVVQDMKKGDLFTRQNVRCIRPGDGMAPANLHEVLSRKATQSILRGTPLSWKLIG
jgi:pseudaminic acid synthase